MYHDANILVLRATLPSLFAMITACYVLRFPHALVRQRALITQNVYGMLSICCYANNPQKPISEPKASSGILMLIGHQVCQKRRQGTELSFSSSVDRGE